MTNCFLTDWCTGLAQSLLAPYALPDLHAEAVLNYMPQSLFKCDMDWL